MSRNIFEGNEPELSPEDLELVHNGPYILLPPLAEGRQYAIKTLSTGQQAVVVEG